MASSASSSRTSTMLGRAVAGVGPGVGFRWESTASILPIRRSLRRGGRRGRPQPQSDASSLPEWNRSRTTGDRRPSPEESRVRLQRDRSARCVEFDPDRCEGGLPNVALYPQSSKTSVQCFGGDRLNREGSQLEARRGGSAGVIFERLPVDQEGESAFEVSVQGVLRESEGPREPRSIRPQPCARL